MANIQLAENLRRLRTDHDYTQTQIGDKLNISRQAYSNYETGKRIPDLDILIRIADIYHVTLEQAHSAAMLRYWCYQSEFRSLLYRNGSRDC